MSESTGSSTLIPEYSELLPRGLVGLDDKGVGLPLELTFFVEQYIKRFFDKGAFHGPQASQLQVQMNTLTDAYGKMETIRLTSIPVAHLYIYPYCTCERELTGLGSIRSKYSLFSAAYFPSL